MRKRRHHTGRGKRSAAAADRRKNQTHVFRHRQPFGKRLLKSDRHRGRARPHCSRYCHFCTGRNAGSDRHEIPARRRLGFSLHQFPDSGKLCRLLYAQQPDARPRHPRLERRPEQNKQYLASRLPKAPERSTAKQSARTTRCSVGVWSSFSDCIIRKIPSKTASTAFPSSALLLPKAIQLP